MTNKTKCNKETTRTDNDAQLVRELEEQAVLSTSLAGISVFVFDLNTEEKGVEASD